MGARSLTVQGVLLGSNPGAGRPGLQVEAWPVRENVSAPVAAATSGSDGRFRLQIVTNNDLGVLRLEFRVLLGGKLLRAEIQDVPVNAGQAAVELFVPRFPAKPLSVVHTAGSGGLDLV